MVSVHHVDTGHGMITNRFKGQQDENAAPCEEASAKSTPIVTSQGKEKGAWNLEHALCVGLAAWTMYFFNWCFTVYRETKSGKYYYDTNGEALFDSPMATRLPTMWDASTLYTLLGALLLEALLYYLVHPVVYTWYSNNVTKELSAEDRHVTSVKATLTFNQLVKSTILVVWGCIVITPASFCPKSLGGNGDITLLYSEAPYATESFPTCSAFYTAMMLRYVFDLLYINTRRTVLPRDFKVMCYHHLITLKLIGASMILNHTNAGSLVMHIHNISEPFLCLCRLSNNVPKFDQLQLDVIFWVLMSSSWFYLRLIVLPKELIYRFTIEAYNIWYYNESTLNFHPRGDMFGSGHFYIIAWSCICFVVLFCMHVNWFTIFMKIASKFFRSGEKVDSIQ